MAHIYNVVCSIKLKGEHVVNNIKTTLKITCVYIEVLT